MQITGNTILITGGGSGIGRALAAKFHQAGNQVIITGRRTDVLADVVRANPGMKSLALDVASADSIQHFASEVEGDFPQLNVVIHNAGIMRTESIRDCNLTDAEDTIATNLLGPIRLTAALLPLLLMQPRAAILTVSSGLAFVPLALTPTYSATKAAIHSYTQSLRQQLRDTNIQVHEIAPPYVQTELLNKDQAADPRAMPLADFIDEVFNILKEQPEAPEVLVERVKPLRFAEVNGNFDHIYAQLNSMH